MQPLGLRSLFSKQAATLPRKVADLVSTMSESMKKVIAVLLGSALLASTGIANAEGCLKGAVVGGVAGHYAGHHAVVGAVGGCVVGRHLAKEKRKQAAAQAQAQAQAQPTVAQ